MTAPLDETTLAQLFLEARTHSTWLDKPVEDALLHRLHALTRMGPTLANTCPMRVVFVKSAAAKEKLKPAMSAGNVDKTMRAPVTAIVAYDVDFLQFAPTLFPIRDLKASMGGHPRETLERMAFQSGSLQGGYLLLAARALGLDCGPMAGFDNAKVDAAFFEGTQWKSNFLMNLGYGDPKALHPRLPRLEFAQAMRIE